MCKDTHINTRMPAERRSVVSGGNSSNQQQSRGDAVDEEYDEVSEHGTDEKGENGEEQEVVLMDVDDEDEDIDLVQYGLESDDDESDGIPSDVENLPEWTSVDLRLAEQDLQCGICLGLLRQTRTFMGCLHRFCRECIDISMRKGYNECPACRSHYPSRRSLRDDPSIDNIIATVFKDISNNDNQIQADNKEIHQQQPVARNEERKRSYRRKRNVHRRRESSRRAANQYVEIEQGQMNQNRHGLDQDNQDDVIMADIMRRRSTRRARASVASSSAANLDGEGLTRDASPGVVLTCETLSWGGGAARSHTRYGSGSTSRRNRPARFAKLVEHLSRAKEDENKFEVQLKLVSFDSLKLENLEKPYLTCPSVLSVDQLREYVARETPLRLRDVELLMVKEAYVKPEQASTSRIHRSSPLDGGGYSKTEFLPLEGSEPLADLYARCPSKNGKLTIAYRQKNAS